MYVLSTQLHCVGVPAKSQVYYNAINSGQVRPLSPETLSKPGVHNFDTAWWNAPICNSLIPDAVTTPLSTSDALFSSFQVTDKDPMSALTNFVCPSCDVEGSSRYLLEYFELFHGMKKAFYSRYTSEENDIRRDRMSECVEARTGDGIISYLAKIHAIDCQQNDDKLLDRCKASEINISHMTNIRQFLMKQLPAAEQNSITQHSLFVDDGNNTINENREQNSITQHSLFDDNGNNTINENSMPIDPLPLEKSCVDHNKMTLMEFDANAAKFNPVPLLSEASATNEYAPQEGIVSKITSKIDDKGNPSINTEGIGSSELKSTIYYEKDSKKWQVKIKGEIFGHFETYRDAVHAASLVGECSQQSKNEQMEDGKFTAGVENRSLLRDKETDPTLSPYFDQPDEGSPKKDPSSLVGFKTGKKYIYRNKAGTNWTVKDDHMYIGSFQTYEEALLAFNSYHDGLIENTVMLSPRRRLKSSSTSYSPGRPKGKKCINYNKRINRWGVTTTDQKYLGLFKNYEDALQALDAHQRSTQNDHSRIYENDNKRAASDMTKDTTASADMHESPLKKVKTQSGAAAPVHSNTAVEFCEDSSTSFQHKYYDHPDGLIYPRVRGICYHKQHDKWQVKIDKKYIGGFHSYDKAIALLRSHVNSLEYVPAGDKRTGVKKFPSNRNIDRVAKKESEKEEYRKTSNPKKKSAVMTTNRTRKQNSLNENTTPMYPSHGFEFKLHDKLDPTYVVGMSIMLYNPVDNSYHSGRIIDCKTNAPTNIDNSDICTYSNIRRLLDSDISTTMYLVRFREGMDGRKVAIHQWVYLEEHSVRVGGEVCWARTSYESDLMNCPRDSARMSPYRPVQIIFRSMLERIHTLQQSEECGKTVFSETAEPANVLAMGFGNSFSSLRICLEENTQSSSEFAQSIEKEYSPSNISNSGVLDGLKTEDSGKTPIVFPFGKKTPLWLNKILHQVRLCDEDIGLAISMATAEQDAQTRIRFSTQLS
eukprot:scaffold11526_cov69-Cyclotella_meneghiniana.AAC.1